MQKNIWIIKVSIVVLAITCLAEQRVSAQFNWKNELEIYFSSDYELAWNDQGSGGDHDCSVWKPKCAAGHFPVGDLIVKGYGNPSGKSIVATVKDLSGKALRPPVDYKRVWGDWGSGSNTDGTVWQPVPPAGYVAMGMVAMSSYNKKPSTNRVMCVRSDLVGHGTLSGSIWSDHGSGADHDAVAYRAVATQSVPEGVVEFSPGTMILVPGYKKPRFHDCARLLRISVKESDAKQASGFDAPKLTSYQSPTAFKNLTRTYETKLPWFAVKDTAMTDIAKLTRSPFYRLMRTDSYELEAFHHNTQSVPVEKAVTYTVGFEESKTKSFETSTGVSLETGYESPGGFSVKVTLSRTFTRGESSTTSRSKARSVNTKLIIPPNSAAALFSVKSTYTLFRKDNSQVGINLDAKLAETTYSTQYPNAGATTTAHATPGNPATNAAPAAATNSAATSPASNASRGIAANAPINLEGLWVDPTTGGRIQITQVGNAVNARGLDESVTRHWTTASGTLNGTSIALAHAKGSNPPHVHVKGACSSTSIIWGNGMSWRRSNASAAATATPAATAAPAATASSPPPTANAAAATTTTAAITNSANSGKSNSGWPFQYRGEIEIGYTMSFQQVWRDSGIRGARNVAFHRPQPSLGHQSVGDLAVSNYDDPNSSRYVLTVRDLSGSATKPPTDFEAIWYEYGSGADEKASLWRPVPPDGYSAMGVVAQKGYDKPSVNSVVCVRNDLLYQASLGDEIWNDRDSGARDKVSMYLISINSDLAMAPGTFVAVGGYEKPASAASANAFRVK